jgi:signal transduction histidine kinase/ActR/RegA family two-component response regulator
MGKLVRDLPIRRKLARLTLAPTIIALLFASIGFFAWDVVQFRNEIERDLLAQARTISENSTAAISFEDPATAGETLAVLEIHPNVRQACMYVEGERLFATYDRDGGGECLAPPPDALTVAWRTATIVRPIVLEERRIGTLVIERDMDDVIERVSVGAAILMALLVLAVLLAMFVARRMQHTIADPLLALASTARTVSETKDYSLRSSLESGDEVGIVVRAFNDMLDAVQQRTAELSKANQLKDEFLATLSHELRTPLNAILGWIRIVRSTNLPPATRERALESIERNAALQARLIEDLLEVSRIVTGKLYLQPERTDLASIIDAAAEIVQPAAAAKGITLTVQVQSRPAMTAGDPGRLQQVVWNLLSNAVKFTPNGGRVLVRLVREHEYVLTVADDGIGIDPVMLPQMFQAFRQMDGSPTREHGGLGLGLAIVRQLVELHGGTVSARSEGPGTGAMFEVRLPSVLPVEEPLRPMPPEQRTTPQRPGTLLQGVRVLIVEDETDASDLLATVLGSYGARVTTAASAQEALQAFDESVPDVIVSDIGMPGEDGYSLMRRIRSRPDAAGGKVPAIALTAYASATDKERALAAGYQVHVSKPFEPDNVVRLVADLSTAGVQR